MYCRKLVYNKETKSLFVNKDFEAYYTLFAITSVPPKPAMEPAGVLLLVTILQI